MRYPTASLDPKPALGDYLGPHHLASTVLVEPNISPTQNEAQRSYENPQSSLTLPGKPSSPRSQATMPQNSSRLIESRPELPATAFPGGPCFGRGGVCHIGVKILPLSRLIGTIRSD